MRGAGERATDKMEKKYGVKAPYFFALSKKYGAKAPYFSVV